MRISRFWSQAVACATVAFCSMAAATQFEFPLGDDTLKSTINTSVQAGAQVRVEDRAADLIGKSNWFRMTHSGAPGFPGICPRTPNNAGTTCQGHLDVPNPLHGTLGLNSFIAEGTGVNQLFLDAPGALSSNGDNGDLNYDPGEITQGLARATVDLTMSWKNFGLFTRGLYFYDFENVGRRDFYPNMGTLGALARNTAEGRGRRGDDRGDPGYVKRVSKVDDQIGKDFQLLDANISGVLPFFGGRELAWKVGRQPINWGESTILIVNSLNTFNPPNVNNLFRPAFLDLAEVLTPIGALKLSTSLTESLSGEVFYQYDWEQVEAAAPGSYLSTVDVGTDIKKQYVNLGFGKPAEDPLQLGVADQVMLSAITDTGERFPIIEKKADKGGQYGAAMRYYAESLNNGTEIGFYAANYHSRLPYFSSRAGAYGCLSGPGAPAPSTAPDNIAFPDQTLGGLLPLLPGGIALSLKDAQDIITVLQACPGADSNLFVESALPAGVAPPAREQVIGPRGDAFDADSISGLLEYPEDIKLYGLSFNTTFGDVSVQGEVAYRPDAPLQVDDLDLAFAALQNPLPWGNKTGGPTDRFDFGLPGVGTVAQLPGARYTIPDYISAYRGRDPYSYRPATIDPVTREVTAPGERIRGWEYFKTAQYNLGGTYIIGPSNWVKASQILLFGEMGATQVFDLPGLDKLQIEGPGTYTHASAGADGSGANGSRRSNSGVIGPSGIRFNPVQQKDGFATDFSWGYRIISIFRYDNVFPGISFENTVIWAHDIDGIAPGPGENFIEGRKNVIANSEVRFAPGWSAALAYVGFFGGGSSNLLHDRDFVNVGVRYRF